MELKHLIVRYRYLKFFVEAFEQSIIADDSAETAQQELYLKYKQAKTYLSFIETAITMLPINKRSNYNIIRLNGSMLLAYLKIYCFKIKGLSKRCPRSRY